MRVFPYPSLCHVGRSTRAEIDDRILDEIAEAEERVMALEKATETVAPDKAIGRLSRMEASSGRKPNAESMMIFVNSSFLSNGT